MSISSIALTSKSGKPLLYRTYNPIPRFSLQETLHSFPKSISATSQHTYLSLPNAILLYQPLNNFYLVIICTK